jgi:hypothetical protein
MRLSGVIVVSLGFAMLQVPGSAQRLDIAARDSALRRAQVRVPLAQPLQQARLDRNPEVPAALPPDKVLSCRFHVEPASGTSPKFDCALPNGEVVRVKYGGDNREVFAEVAATRLLAALGFPADFVSVVAGVRCYGCPVDPFPVLQRCWHDGEVERACLGAVRYDLPREFSPAIVERRFPGRTLETRKLEGWGWHELDIIDERGGGATRAEVDAFRLLALFLAHWDNKPDNQRLVCLDPPSERPDRPCERVIAMIGDPGATFGPPKATLTGWATAPIWEDSGRCTVSMNSLPFGGSSFHNTRISEEGRQLLASLLNQLSREQIEQLFRGARFEAVDDWVRVFDRKRREIADAGPCGKS